MGYINSPVLDLENGVCLFSYITYIRYWPLFKRDRVVVLDLPIPVQSVPITTNVVNSTLAQPMCIRYNIMW